MSEREEDFFGFAYADHELNSSDDAPQEQEQDAAPAPPAPAVPPAPSPIRRRPAAAAKPKAKGRSARARPKAYPRPASGFGANACNNKIGCSEDRVADGEKDRFYQRTTKSMTDGGVLTVPIVESTATRHWARFRKFVTWFDVQRGTEEVRTVEGCLTLPTVKAYFEPLKTAHTHRGRAMAPGSAMPSIAFLAPSIAFLCFCMAFL